MRLRLAWPCLSLTCVALPSLALPVLAIPCIAGPCLALPFFALPRLAYRPSPSPLSLSHPLPSPPSAPLNLLQDPIGPCGRFAFFPKAGSQFSDNRVLSYFQRLGLPEKTGPCLALPGLGGPGPGAWGPRVEQGEDRAKHQLRKSNGWCSNASDTN